MDRGGEVSSSPHSHSDIWCPNDLLRYAVPARFLHCKHSVSPFRRSQSRSAGHTQGRGINSTSSRKTHQNMCRHLFKSPQQLMHILWERLWGCEHFLLLLKVTSTDHWVHQWLRVHSWVLPAARTTATCERWTSISLILSMFANWNTSVKIAVLSFPPIWSFIQACICIVWTLGYLFYSLVVLMHDTVSCFVVWIVPALCLGTPLAVCCCLLAWPLSF